VFAGVFWETQDVIIQDIERIEVTRGPGGSVWGANAVNGVINVITRKAADTRGTFVNISNGTSMLGPYAIRHGGRLGDTTSYRAYAKLRFEDAHQLVSGASAQDDVDFGQAGFRIESERPAESIAFFQGRRLHRHDRTDGWRRSEYLRREFAGAVVADLRGAHLQRAGVLRSHLSARAQSILRRAQHLRSGCAASHVDATRGALAWLEEEARAVA